MKQDHYDSLIEIMGHISEAYVADALPRSFREPQLSDGFTEDGEKQQPVKRGISHYIAGGFAAAAAIAVLFGGILMLRRLNRKPLDPDDSGISTVTDVTETTDETDTTTTDETFTVGDLEYKISPSGRSAYVTGYIGDARNASVTIPAEVKGLPVTDISQNAFSSYSGLRSITIPETVTFIGNSAFAGCTGLTGIRLPDGLKRISDHVFQKCEALTGITIPDGMTEIGISAFEGCRNLTEIKIPNSVRIIWGAAFDNCTGLTDITIPNSVTNISEYMFSGCTGLKSITIPDSVTHIGDNAFSGCSGLENITIPDGVTEIGSSAFESCSGLTEISIPDSVTLIGSYAFRNCSRLTSIRLPDNFTNVGRDILADTPLSAKAGPLLIVDHILLRAHPETEKFVIPDGVTAIADYAFADNTVLKDITVPESMEAIGYDAFAGCGQLTVHAYSWSGIGYGSEDNRVEFDIEYPLRYHFDSSGKPVPDNSDDLISDGTYYYYAKGFSVYRADDQRLIMTIKNPYQYLRESDRNGSCEVVLWGVTAVGTDWLFIEAEIDIVDNDEPEYGATVYFWVNKETGVCEEAKLGSELSWRELQPAPDGKSFIAIDLYETHIIQVPVPGSGKIRKYDLKLNSDLEDYYRNKVQSIAVLDNGKILFGAYPDCDAPQPNEYTDEMGLYELNPADGSVRILQKRMCLRLFRAGGKIYCRIDASRLAEYLPESNSFRDIADLSKWEWNGVASWGVCVSDCTADAVILTTWWDSDGLDKPDLLVSLKDGSIRELPRK